MDRRRYTWLLAALAFAAPSAQAADERPNVLFVALDDLNHWVGCYGRNPQARTPNIDALAARGVRFTRAYCAAPACNPSRAALMSGLRPSTTGVYDNGDDWRPHIAPDKTLNTTFRNAGYFVCGAGKIYHGGFDRRSEWDDYLKNEGGYPKRLAPTAKNDGVGGIKFAPLDCDDSDIPDYRIVQYGIDQLQRAHEKPFFLAVGLHKPHMPWNVPQKYFDMFPLDSIELPPHTANDLADVPPAGVRMAGPQGDHAAMLASGRWKEAVQAYLATIAYADGQIGRLIAALDASRYRDNTIVVLWGDHGWHLGEKEHWRKFALWEEATRAPLIWIAPGVTHPAQVCERPVDFMSIYATLTDLCGVPTPAHVEGPSLKPLLADPAAAWTRPALTTHGRQNHAVRSADWRYIRYADGAEELYDETADPYEYTNLAAQPDHAARKAELAQALPETNVPDVSGGREARKAARGDGAVPKKARRKPASPDDD